MIDKVKQLFSSFITGKKLAVSGVGLTLVLGILVFTIYEITKTNVTIMAEEEVISTSTHAGTVGEALEEQGIDVGFHDDIEPSLETELTDELDITVIHANQILMLVDGEQSAVWTTAENVEELLNEYDIEVGEHDLLEPPLETRLTSDTSIVYEPAFEITVQSDGEEERIWTTSTTVADFLERESITLNELDRVEPGADERLNEATDVIVTRVEKVTDVVEETVDFATVSQNDSSLEQGNEEILQSGKDGKIEKHYEVIIEDGEEVSRELVQEEVVEESEDQILAVGTKAPVTETTTTSRSASSPNSSSSSDSNSSSGSSSSSDGGSWVSYTATAYSANCAGCSGVTATGINLKENPDANVIAVDPSVIPLGSRVEVKGYGTFLAADTGGAISGKKIDIFMPNGAGSFGRKNVEVRVLE
ncbi:G5 and 3D domain-containing protein [Alteribacter populi]|uniref:G5 and 3D domain-containing protein n=1 Tax=Alteribacter populi TaxID=2011011 RepID=UPI000BBB2AE3|nr:G5 and 3D domain-containing protein [Alteribacter populi]